VEGANVGAGAGDAVGEALVAPEPTEGARNGTTAEADPLYAEAARSASATAAGVDEVSAEEGIWMGSLYWLDAAKRAAATGVVYLFGIEDEAR
jgi:hypothetical protein